MSSETKPRKLRSTKSKSELEAKIAELEAKINQLSSQVQPSQTRSTPPPAPKPREAPRPSSESSTVSSEVAPAYANTSSTGYTGNKYYATRARLAYHPPDKQFKGEPVVTTQKPAPTPEIQYTYEETTSSQQKPKSSSSWKAKGAQAAEEYTSEMTPQTRPAETRPAPPPAPKPRPAASGPSHGTLPAGMAPPKPTAAKTVEQVSQESKAVGEVAPAYATLSSTGYTGNKYYATRARLSYHPPDKQFKGEAQAATVQVAETPKPKRGTLPAGWKP